LIRQGLVSEAGCRDEHHTVCESDRLSKDGSELTLLVDHDVNRLMTGDAHGELNSRKSGTRLGKGTRRKQSENE
jgi:hypothetical protein